MPISTETIPNRPLSGTELRELIRADFERLLNNEGLLSGHIGFGRCAYRIVLKLETGNHMHPQEPSHVESRGPAVNVAAQHPQLAAVESHPLDPPPADLSKGGKQLTREIASPNAERVRAGLPIPVDVRDPRDGVTRTEYIHYPRESVLEGDGAMAVSETEARPAPAPSPVPSAPSPACHCGHDHAHHALSGICAEHNAVGASCGCQEFRDARIPLPAPDTRQAFVGNPEKS